MMYVCMLYTSLHNKFGKHLKKVASYHKFDSIYFTKILKNVNSLTRVFFF